MTTLKTRMFRPAAGIKDIEQEITEETETTFLCQTLFSLFAPVQFFTFLIPSERTVVFCSSWQFAGSWRPAGSRGSSVGRSVADAGRARLESAYCLSPARSHGRQGHSLAGLLRLSIATAMRIYGDRCGFRGGRRSGQEGDAWRADFGAVILNVAWISTERVLEKPANTGLRFNANSTALRRIPTTAAK